MTDGSTAPTDAERLMGIYRRPDSPFWWLLLERAKRKPIREATKIPFDGGGVPELTKELKRQAQEAYATRMGELASGKPKLIARTFEEHRLWYAEHVSAHKRSGEHETSALVRLGRFFDTYDLTAIDHALVREWRTQRLTSAQPVTVNREEWTLRHVLATAIPKYLQHHPLKGLRSLRTQRKDVRIVTPDEEARILNSAPNQEIYTLILCALDTLLRLSNVRNLTRAQDHGDYLFSDTKVDIVRIPISARLRKALDARPKKGPFYFPSFAGRWNHHAEEMFIATCKKAKVKTGRAKGGVSFHCLRHTGASRMLAAGIDVKTVMEIGGWKNLKVMERYLHPTEARKVEAVNSIGQHTLQSRHDDRPTRRTRQLRRQTRSRSSGQQLDSK